MNYIFIPLLIVLLFLSACSNLDLPIVEDNPANKTSAMVTFTFDDATLDQFEVGYPILDKYDYNATLFVITGLVNSTFENRSVMSWSDIHDLNDDGWDIQSHSYSHPFFTSLGYDQAVMELSYSKLDLADQGFNASIFSFPYGDLSEGYVELAKTYYSIVRGSYQGYNSNVSNPDTLRSQWTVNSTSSEDMKLWLDTAIENDSWLIVMIHRVSYESGDEYSIKPEILESFIDYINEKQVPVKTLSEVLLE